MAGRTGSKSRSAKAHAVFKAWKPKRAKRRVYYHHGDCDNCGLENPVTWIQMLKDGMRYKVCKQCIKYYEGDICDPE